jgi:uncharacterized membrane protein (UPF0127 family)
MADSFTDRMLGLLLQSNPRNMMFKTRFGIHTLFLTKPIDIVILNSSYQIVKIKKTLRPNSFLFWSPKYSLVLELEAGTINRFNLRKNDLVVIK